MKGLILAGGYATRLRPLSCSKPKLLFPIVGVPLIDLMIEWLKPAGVDEVILAVNHLADQLRAQIGEQRNGCKISYSVEREPLGTGGPIRLAHKILGTSEDFIVVNGDIVSDINLSRMVSSHQQEKAQATIALVQAAETSAYGRVNLGKASVIEEFSEKSKEAKGPGLVNAGVYVLSPKVIERIPLNGMASIERQVFPELIKGREMRGWLHGSGYWYDIGKIPDYLLVNRELLDREWSSRIEERAGGQGPYHIGNRSLVDKHATLGPRSILCDRVTIRKGASVKDSIIFEDTVIGENSRVEGAIVGEKVAIGSNVQIGAGSLVAGQISIPSDRAFAPNSVILNA